MAKRTNWQEFKDVLVLHNIHKLYHFTDRDNLEPLSKMAVFTHGKIAKRRTSLYQNQVAAVLDRYHGA